MSQRRAATSASGRSADSSTVDHRTPRISSGSLSGAGVNDSDRPSSARWSGGKSVGRPYGHQAPASEPPADRRTPAAGRALGSARTSAPSTDGNSRRPVIPGDGHCVLATHRPGRSSCRRSGTTVLHPRPQQRPVHRAVVGALEPVVPPAHALLQEADPGAGISHLRPAVTPRADQPAAGDARRIEAGQRTPDRRSCNRRPSPRRAGRRSPARRSPRRSTLPPELVAALVRQPRLEERRACSRSRSSHISRQRVADDHGSGGSASSPSMYAPQLSTSWPSTQPPM